MKRIIKVLGIFIITIILVTANIQKLKVYSADENLTIDIGENYGNSGTEVSVPVYLSNSPQSGISAMNMVLEFDEGLVLNSVKAGYLISNTSDLSYTIKDNKVHILFSDSSTGNSPVKGNGILCYLQFKVSASASGSSFTIRRVASDNDIFVNNYLATLNPDFIDGKIIKKDNLYTVSSDKIWRITFSQQIDPVSLSDGSIEVTDINGDLVYCSIYSTNGNKTIEIYPPYENYERFKSYSLAIKNTFSSKGGTRLSKEQIINFYIEK